MYLLFIKGQFINGKIVEAQCSNPENTHWDLVCIQTQEYGGGERYFDDVRIRKDGKFVLSELEALNPK